MDKLKMHSPDQVEKNLDRLAELFPGCVTITSDERTGRIVRAVDFDRLRQEVSSRVVEGPRERFHLDWPGKREALLLAGSPVAKTLRPRRAESVDFDTTKNIFIEGDNLDCLKLLREAYLGRVRVIYIDPPYNTGTDFIYSDDFTSDARTHLIKSNQVDETGTRLVANPETNGRFHSDWLSMIAPRLRIARDLLTEDGAIFVSIGIEELASLRLLMGEIFGNSNFVEVFSWIKTSTPPALSTKSRKTAEYIVCFERTISGSKYYGSPLDGDDQPLLNRGNKVAELRFPPDKVSWSPSAFRDGLLGAYESERVALLDDIVLSGGKADRAFRMRGEFKWSQAFLDNEIANGTTFVVKSHQLSVRFSRTEEGSKRPTNFIRWESLPKVFDKPGAGVDTNESASAALQDLLGADVFDHPKPVSLVAYLCRFLSRDDDIVLDFFAGSGTTAHAVMELNRLDGGRRRWISVQLPETIDPATCTDASSRKRALDAIKFLDALGQPHTIAEIAKERIRRAGTRVYENSQGAASTIDVGFRVLRLDTSNMADVFYSPDDLQQKQLVFSADNIKDGRTEEDLLFQVLLDWGVDPALPIEDRNVRGHRVFLVDGNALAACFGKGVDEALVRELAKLRPLRAVFRDGGYASDSTKINVEQIFKLLSPETEVRSL